ncbi:hypothetical protein UT300012_31250 [Paraclostridium bifermentans]
MNRNFKVEKLEDDFVKIEWKLKNTIDRPFVWSEIKDMPLISDSGEPIGLLKDFNIKSNNDKFGQILKFIVFPKCEISKFKDIEIVLLDNDKFEFRII